MNKYKIVVRCQKRINYIIRYLPKTIFKYMVPQIILIMPIIQLYFMMYYSNYMAGYHYIITHIHADLLVFFFFYFI